MKILVTNDDGIASPGLWALAEALIEVGEVIVVAPDREQSGVGCSVTLHHPVRITPTPSRFDGIETYAVEGTPGDSVVLATSTIIKGPVDLLVSGINHGSNLGNDVYVSGTVGAAFHGYFRGIPSVAVSVTSLTDVRYDAASRIALMLANRAKEGSLPKEILLNVNLPNKSLKDLKGVQVTRLGSSSYTEIVEEGRDPRRKYHWIKRTRPAWRMETGTDIWAVQNDYISMTPLHADITAQHLFSELEDFALSIED